LLSRLADDKPLDTKAHRQLVHGGAGTDVRLAVTRRDQEVITQVRR
jgi:hypothetical protein